MLAFGTAICVQSKLTPVASLVRENPGGRRAPVDLHFSFLARVIAIVIIHAQDQRVHCLSLSIPTTASILSALRSSFAHRLLEFRVKEHGPVTSYKYTGRYLTQQSDPASAATVVFLRVSC